MARAKVLVVARFRVRAGTPSLTAGDHENLLRAPANGTQWHAGLRGESLGRLVDVSQVEPVTVEEALAKLSDDDRAWLEERRVEYRELLNYLHDH